MSTMPPLVIGEYTIDPALFRLGYADGGSPCSCTSTCCRGGVYADVRERDRIMEHRDLIRPHMDDSQPQNDAEWFEPEEADDADFPSGRCVGTRDTFGKCTFLDRQGRCSLQVAAVAAGRDRWALKPLYCVLFPIEITDRVVGFDDMLQDEQPCCSVSERFVTPLFRACRDELVHLLGEEGYRRIEEHYAQHAGAPGVPADGGRR